MRADGSIHPLVFFTGALAINLFIAVGIPALIQALPFGGN